MRTVWKYTLDIANDNRTVVPEGATLLAAQVVWDNPKVIELWFDVESTAATEQRDYFATGTGHPVPEQAEHMATTKHEPTGLVWHVWELLP